MTDGPGPTRAEQTRTWLARVLAVVVFAASCVLLASWGLTTPLGATASLILTLVDASVLPALWMAASLGTGAALCKRLAPGWPLVLALCVGVGVHLTLAHAIGALSLYGPSTRTVAAWTPVGLGIVLLLVSWPDVKSKARGPQFGWPMVLAAPGVALLLVACAQPPGAIWASEAHAYDSLSYHLQLPREWLALGVLRPLEHNVYSFLPSSMESAYLQLMAMRPGDPAAGAASPLFSAHLLHAMLAIASAVALGRFVTDRASVLAGRWAMPLTLSIPWVIVVASLAYNEMAVTFMAAGALIALFDDDLAPIRRGVLIGFLMGVAASVKPTAMFTLALPVGVGMLLRIPAKQWVAVFLATGVVGVLTLAPWLVRNAVASGNPVFPALTDLFGTAHWSAEQAQRWAGGHAEHAGAGGRLALLLGERGLGHAQWSLFGPMVALSALACLASTRTRSAAVVLVAILAAQLVGWMSVGHLQPRFLLPAAPVGVALVALAAHASPGWFVRIVLAAACLTLGTVSVTNYLDERQNNPNWALVAGARVFTEPVGGELRSATPAAFVRSLPAGSRTLLVGDATPLYFPSDVIYHTTWDASPYGEALEASNGDVAGAIARLRSLGVTHALVNLDEVVRLTGDGWYDPRVTPELAAQLIEASRPVRSWTEGRASGTHLVRLVPPSGAAGP